MEFPDPERARGISGIMRARCGNVRNWFRTRPRSSKSMTRPRRARGCSIKAWVVYGAGLFELTFTISLAGEINMLEDRPIWAMPLPDDPEE